MAILSSLFGGSDSETGNSSNLLGALDAVGSIDASHSSYDQSTDSDGSSHTSADSSEFGANLDVGSLLSNITDNFSDSSSDHSGIFG